MKLARGEAAWQAADGGGRNHASSLPPNPASSEAEKGKEELGDLAIPEGSHTVHTRQKPKKQQTRFCLFRGRCAEDRKGLGGFKGRGEERGKPAPGMMTSLPHFCGTYLIPILP